MKAAEFAPFALELAQAAREVTLHWLEIGCAAEDKSGGGAFDPVTEADRGAERAIRERIEARYPDHGIRGEEYPDRPARGPWTWSLDPVDGTRAFVCGLPSWTTLIALLHEDAPVLGLIDAPRLGELYVGDGEEARLVTAGGACALRASGCRSLAEARLTTTDPALFDDAGLAAFARVRDRAQLVRYGLDAYGYARLAAGTIDLVVEAGLKPHDWNALVPVVRGAGGVIGDWEGGDDLAPGRILAAASPRLYEEAVALLRG